MEHRSLISFITYTHGLPFSQVQVQDILKHGQQNKESVVF